MANEEREQIIIPDDNGDEHLFEKIYEFTVDETGKSYMMLAPVGNDDDDDSEEEVDVIAFRYEEGDKEDDLALYQIETDEEWEMIEEIWNTLSEDDLL